MWRGVKKDSRILVLYLQKSKDKISEKKQNLRQLHVQKERKKMADTTHCIICKLWDADRVRIGLLFIFSYDSGEIGVPTY